MWTNVRYFTRLLAGLGWGMSRPLRRMAVLALFVIAAGVTAAT